MKRALKWWPALVGLIALPMAANAYLTSTPTTYSDLLWRVSSSVNGLAGCTELQVDATGDLVNSSKLTIYGALNCPFEGGSYGVVGSGYFGADDSFNMTLLIGSSISLQCTRWPGLSGSCTYADTSGRTLGNAFLSFFP